MITCRGRAVDLYGAPVGDPCGTVYHRACGHCTRPLRRADIPVEDLVAHVARMATRARAAGWAVHIVNGAVADAICPRCRRPKEGTR